MKSVVSAPIMWLKPINGTRNGLFISMLNAKKSIADSVSYNLFGVDEDVVDFTFTDMGAAWKEWSAMQKDFMLGKGKHNKLWLLTKHFKYLPDNYDWATNENHVLSQRADVLSAGFGARTMYMFHTIPEEWNAMMVMAAQMKHMKFEGKSLWDHYSVVTKDGVSEVQWTGGSRGVVLDSAGNVQKRVEGIDSREMGKMKRVYQAMHGGYRREERVAMEAYVFGELFLQFKKYLPAILFNAMRSKSEDPSLGHYKFTGDKHNGEEVMEWVSAVSEGRWRVMGKTLANYMNLRNDPAYSFEQMPQESKKQLVDGVMTILTSLMLMAAYFAIFGDADDDDPFKRLSYVIISNFSQQYNIYDIGKNFTTMPATFTKSFSSMEALASVSFYGSLYLAGFEDFSTTGKGEIKGWTEVKRSIPYLSAKYDIDRFMDGTEDSTFFNMRGGN